MKLCHQVGNTGLAKERNGDSNLCGCNVTLVSGYFDAKPSKLLSLNTSLTPNLSLYSRPSKNINLKIDKSVILILFYTGAERNKPVWKTQA